MLSSRWQRPRFRRFNLVLALGAAVASTVVVGTALGHPSAWYTADYPPSAADAVARIAAQDRSVRIFANESYADWLLWRHPNLAGRIAFDARFELLKDRQLRNIVEFRARVGTWWRIPAGYRVLVLDPTTEDDVAAGLRARGAHIVFRSPDVIVLTQGGAR
jgi:hypothetical protein